MIKSYKVMNRTIKYETGGKKGMSKESGGWIKCSERMPDTAKVWGCVKFHDEKGHTFYQEEVVFYDGDGIFTNYGNVPVPVVAWHPLPEPYKG